ncbi:hypothetical protein HYU14_05935 [Candidatus Woesearchaeota archaeon]|nr:hypothetical protein [Candidatus Woesearchaeota archaeon]
MFTFLKKFFSTGDEPVNVSIASLPQWLEDAAKPHAEKLSSAVEQKKQELSEEIHSAREKIDALSSATLPNPNISVREKQFLDGNRNAYLLYANNFLSSLDHDGITRHSLPDFSVRFDEKLQQFAKSTLRPYQILQEFLANESRDVAISVRAIEGHVKGMRQSVELSPLSKISRLKALAGELNSRLSQKKNVEEEMKKLGDDITLAEKSISAEQQNLNDLRDSGEYKTYLDAKADREIQLKKISDISSSVSQPFATLEMALRKYGHIASENLEVVGNYLQDSAKAMAEDEGLAIIDALQKVKQCIIRGEIELKDKKKEKTMAVLGQLTAEWLAEKRKERLLLSHELSSIDGKISANKAKGWEEKLAEKIQSLEIKKERMVFSLQELGKKSEGFVLGDAKKELENEIAEVLGRKLVISS